MEFGYDHVKKVISFELYTDYAMRLIDYIFCASERMGQSVLKEFKMRKWPLSKWTHDHSLLDDYLGGWRGMTEAAVCSVFAYHNRWTVPDTAWEVYCGVGGRTGDGGVCVGVGQEWQGLHSLYLYDPDKYRERKVDELSEVLFFYKKLVKFVCEMFIENNAQNNWKASQHAGWWTKEAAEKFNEDALLLARAIINESGAELPERIVGEKLDEIQQAALAQCMATMKQCKRNVEEQKIWHECNHMRQELLGLV